jgi:hypothetical protein
MTKRTLTRRLFPAAVALTFCVGLLLGAGRGRDSRAVGDLLGDVLKGGAVTIAVMEFADQLDKGINALLQQKGIETQGMTKVVPIIRVGSRGGGQAGAAQVVGPAEQVRKVEAVAEAELGLGPFRGRALIPVATKNPLKGQIKGVDGVGVNASIKVRL